ncbi:hypothetical protein B0H65DRAFT_278433 [Neurospora tetraspora]|uniref:Uncharacterized protein n=1 Tax=Neurospora tetraspora TaxID=94610 RepID=A0AAE0MQ94_9PEZI|nr:hypothetical protein B0H65DRAFT_278433 [Neurospora tetraspora]
MNSIFGPAKAWFVSLPTSSPASDPEPAARSSSNSTSGHSHANDASSSSPKSTKPDDESSSDDDCFNAAIQDRLRQNPVQEIPKEEKVEDKEPFGGRFENMRAVHAKESKGTEDSDHATKSLQPAFPISSIKHDKPTSSNTQSNNYNATSKPSTNGSNKGEGTESEGAINLPVSQSASSTNRIGTPIARHSRETPSIVETGSSKRPLVVQDIEALSRSGSVDSAKRRRLSIGRHQTPCFDQLFSKDQRQRFKRESGSSHSRTRAPSRPLSKNLVSRMSPGSNLDKAKSKEIVKSIRDTPTTAGAKATEKIQQIKERAKEAQTPKRTEEQVVREFTKAPIESLFGGKPASNPTGTIVASSSQQNKAAKSIFGDKTASNPTNTIVPSRSQPTKDTRGTQGDKNQTSRQPATHRAAQATQPSLPIKKPSQPGDAITYEDHFKHIKDKYPQPKPATIVNRLPDIQQSSKENGRPLRTPTARKRNKPTATLASSSKNPPTPRTNINAGPTVLPSVPAPPHHLPAAPSAPEPAPAAAIPPPPPTKAVPAQSLLSPTDVILQYVIYRTDKYCPLTDPNTPHFRTKPVFISKKEANETCGRRVFEWIKTIPIEDFRNLDRQFMGNNLFQGTITYEDGDVQLYYVREEAKILGEVVKKRGLWLDEEGMGIYTKKMWAVWAVRYYSNGEEEEHQQQGQEGKHEGASSVGGGVGSGRVEVVDEGNEGDDEDDGEEDEDLLGDRTVNEQLNEGVVEVGEGVGQESSEGSGVMAGEGVDKTGEKISDDLDISVVQMNLDSQTEGHQTQTEPEIHTQQEVTSETQSKTQTQSENQSHASPQTQLEGHHRANIQGHPEPHKTGVEGHSGPQPEPNPPTNLSTPARTEHNVSNPTQPQTQPTKPPRPPTPPLPCSLYSPPPPSTIYSSSSESDTEHPSRSSRTRGRSLPNNIPPPPPPLPSSILLTPKTTHHGTFTTLRLANLEVLEVFKQLARPGTARYSDVYHWREEVLPEAERVFKEMGCNDDDGDNDREGKEEGGGIEKTPIKLEWVPDAQLFKWRFRKVEVWVEELELKGPKDLGGLEVKMPQGNSGNSGSFGPSGLSGSKTGSGSGSGSGTGTASSSSATGNGNVRAGTRTGTTVKVTTTSPKTAPDNTPTTHEQWKHYKNAQPVLAAKAKAKKRRRPTREEKGKGKAVDVDPVVTNKGTGNGAEQGIVDAWAAELGGSEDGDLSEED